MHLFWVISVNIAINGIVLKTTIYEREFTFAKNKIPGKETV